MKLLKHFGFTIQFLLLLLAIPVLMYVEITRDDKRKEKEEITAKDEMAFSKKIQKAESAQLISFTILN